MQSSEASEKYLRDRELALEKAERYWKKTKTFGPVAIDPRVLEILNKEHKSVAKLFGITAQFALTGKSDYLKFDGTPHGSRVIVSEGGGRRWDIRSLAATAKMAPGTVHRSLKRLQELGLIFIDTSRRWGTYVLIKCFSRFTNRRSWRASVAGPPSGSTSGVSMADTFDLPPEGFSFIKDHIDVEVRKKEGDSSQKPRLPDRDRAELHRIFPEIPSWA